MKERPILFSAPMVRAILDGMKTQTRRVVKQDREGLLDCEPTPAWDAFWRCVARPYGEPGDRLWVRETYFAWGRWETRFSAKKGRDEWHFIDMTLESGRSYAYNTDEDTPMLVKRRSTMVLLWWRRPAIFMPRAASRILLEITAVRVERLQDISEDDARAEGIAYSERFEGYCTGEAEHFNSHDPRQSYFSLWEAINGAGSVAANPWVWVVEFKRIDVAEGS